MTPLAHAGAADESLAIVMVFAALWIGWIGRSRLKGTGFRRLPRAGAYALLTAAAGLLVASAVVPRAIFPTTAPGAPSTTVTGPRPASAASLSITSPRPSEVVDGNELDVVLSLQAGTVVDASATDLRPDTGHIHLSLDGRLVSMTFGTVQVVGLEGVQPGAHTLQAEFVAADHAPFDPRVTASVTFTIEAAP